MLYFLIPLAAVLVIGLLCLNVKIGFIVGDLTEDTGFDTGFYMMTVIGLIAVEASVGAYLFEVLT